MFPVLFHHARRRSFPGLSPVAVALFHSCFSGFPLAADSASAPPHPPAGCCAPVTVSSVLASRTWAMVLRAVGTPASFLGFGASVPASEAENWSRPMGKKGRNTDYGCPRAPCQPSLLWASGTHLHRKYAGRSFFSSYLGPRHLSHLCECFL